MKEKYALGDKVTVKDGSEYDGQIFTVINSKPGHRDAPDYFIRRGDGLGFWITEDLLMIYDSGRMLSERVMEMPDETKKLLSGDKVNSPDYYNRYSVEVVEMARRIWGDDAMKTAAEITAFIYRIRMGTKPDNPIEQDFDKEMWWLEYGKSL